MLLANANTQILDSRHNLSCFGSNLSIGINEPFAKCKNKTTRWFVIQSAAGRLYQRRPQKHQVTVDRFRFRSRRCCIERALFWRKRPPQGSHRRKNVNKTTRLLGGDEAGSKTQYVMCARNAFISNRRGQLDPWLLWSKSSSHNEWHFIFFENYGFPDKALFSTNRESHEVNINQLLDACHFFK